MFINDTLVITSSPTLNEKSMLPSKLAICQRSLRQKANDVLHPVQIYFRHSYDDRHRKELLSDVLLVGLCIQITTNKFAGDSINSFDHRTSFKEHSTQARFDHHVRCSSLLPVFEPKIARAFQNTIRHVDVVICNREIKPKYRLKLTCSS